MVKSESNKMLWQQRQLLAEEVFKNKTKRQEFTVLN
jgi:hypothetical protein